MLRYRPLLVALHWSTALMILVALDAGGLVLASMPTRVAHGIDATALVALIALHIAAALYHQPVTNATPVAA